MSKETDIRLIQFGSHVRKLRKDLGLSLDHVAANSNLTKSNLSEIERGNRNLAFTTLLEIAKGLDVDPKKLLDYDESIER